MSLMIHPIILSGGSGSRLWPLSRTGYPKQFLPLLGEDSLFQKTLERIKSIPDAESPRVICNEEHRFLVVEQAQEIDVKPTSILLEPIARNTAPAVTLAALQLQSEGKTDDLMLILPSDHIIANPNAFYQAIEKASVAASKGHLVTFGILPTQPETGYGYIKKGLDHKDGSFKVEEFVEKPDLDKAKAYLASGNYFWNSGMFLFKVSAFLDEIKLHSPDILHACEKALVNLQKDLDFSRIDKEAFTNCPSDSIDYAVMEKTQHAAVVPLDAEWNDVGAWPAVWEVLQKDNQGNAHQGDVIIESSNNNYVHANHRLVSLLGVEDLMVIETSDVVLVTHKDQAQDVKKIVDQLKKSKRTEHETHRKVFRPWGAYDSIDSGKNFQVKRITVKPGEKLSLQLHHKRSEHWVVVSGTAKIRIGDETKTLNENESIYIPIGTMHSLENPGKLPLELIEVQTGSYLGEDDIVRFEDRYGRK
jgi:mannose-1-phosphate guanylyltransferase/mannose-6-phosphate isomerase